MELIDKQILGHKIHDIRIDRQETLEEFANQIKKKTNNNIKTTKSNVSKWEKGLNVPNDVTLKAIAELGGIDVKKLKGNPFKITPEMESMRYAYLVENSLLNLGSINRYVLLENDDSFEAGHAVLEFTMNLRKAIENGDKEKIIFISQLIKNIFETRGIGSDAFLQIPTTLKENDKIKKFNKKATNEDLIKLVDRFEKKTSELQKIQFEYFKCLLEDLNK